MRKNLVRNLTIVAGLFVIAFFGKMEAINAIIAIWIGIWSIIKLFKPFFKSGESVGNLSTVDFIPEPRHIIFNLLFSDKQKLTLLVVTWWILGVGIMVATYQALDFLFISP